jgi:hypothetical protein
MRRCALTVFPEILYSLLCCCYSPLRFYILSNFANYAACRPDNFLFCFFLVDSVMSTLFLKLVYSKRLLVRFNSCCQ